MSSSAFLLAFGMSTPTTPVIDLALVAAFAKVDGDLGRIAVLLKLWIVENSKEQVKGVGFGGVIREFRELQGEVRTVTSEMVCPALNMDDKN